MLIRLAPVTAALTALCVLAGKTPPTREPFLPDRFPSKEP